jgi:hypothetical protein
MGGTGVLTAPITPSYPIGATASWNNDSLTVRGPAGASLPDAVLLQFQIDVTPTAYAQPFNAISQSVGINGQQHSIGSGGDKLIQLQTPQGMSTGPQVGTFNIKLALHSDGVSDPFSLSVSSNQYVAANWWTQSWALTPSSISLSLTGVTLPDGTPLSSAGYAVTFASGMTLPEQPVPEPAALVAWTLLAIGALSVRRRCVARA